MEQVQVTPHNLNSNDSEASSPKIHIKSDKLVDNSKLANAKISTMESFHTHNPIIDQASLDSSPSIFFTQHKFNKQTIQDYNLNSSLYKDINMENKNESNLIENQTISRRRANEQVIATLCSTNFNTNVDKPTDAITNEPSHKDNSLQSCVTFNIPVLLPENLALNNIIVVNETSVSIPQHAPTSSLRIELQSQVCTLSSQLINLALTRQKRVVAIVRGPSGAGKTHLSKFLLGIQPNIRSVRCNNDDIRLICSTPYDNNDNETINALTEERFSQALVNGHDLVILDNVNSAYAHFASSISLAFELNILVILVDLTFPKLEDLEYVSSRSSITHSNVPVLTIVTGQYQQGIKVTSALNAYSWNTTCDCKTYVDRLEHFAPFSAKTDIMSYYNRTLSSVDKSSIANSANQFYVIIDRIKNIKKKIVLVHPYRNLTLHQFSFNITSDSDDNMYDMSDIAKRYLRRGIVFLVDSDNEHQRISLVTLGMRKFTNYFGSTTPIKARYNVVDSNQSNAKPIAFNITAKEDGQAVFLSGHVTRVNGNILRILVVSTKRDCIALTSFSSYNSYIDRNQFMPKHAVIQAAVIFESIFIKDQFNSLVEYLDTSAYTLVFEMMTPRFDFRVIEHHSVNIDYYLLAVVDNTAMFSDAPSSLDHKITRSVKKALKNFMLSKKQTSIGLIDPELIDDDFKDQCAHVYKSEREGVVVTVVQNGVVQSMIKVKSTYFLLVRRISFYCNSLFNIFNDANRVSTMTTASMTEKYSRYVSDTLSERFIVNQPAAVLQKGFVKGFQRMCESYGDQNITSDFLTRWLEVYEDISTEIDFSPLTVDHDRLHLPTFSLMNGFIVPLIITEISSSPASSYVEPPISPVEDLLVPVTIMMKQSDMTKFVSSTSLSVSGTDVNNVQFTFEVSAPSRTEIERNLVTYSDETIVSTVNDILYERLDAAKAIIALAEDAVNSMGYNENDLSVLRKFETQYNPHCLQTPDAIYSSSITHHISPTSLRSQYTPHDMCDKTTPINMIKQQVNAAVCTIDRVMKAQLGSTSATYQRFSTSVPYKSHPHYRKDVNSRLDKGWKVGGESGSTMVSNELIAEMLDPPMFSTNGYKLRYVDNITVLVNPLPSTVEVLSKLYPYIDFRVFSDEVLNNKAVSEKVKWETTPQPIRSASVFMKNKGSKIFTMLCFRPRSGANRNLHEVCTYLVDLHDLMDAHAAGREPCNDTRLHNVLIEVQLPVFNDNDVFDVSKYKSGNWNLFTPSGINFISGEQILPIYSSWRSNTFFVYSTMSRVLANYSTNTLCDVMYHYNTRVRSTPLKNHYSISGFDHCHDCVTFLNTLETHSNNRKLFRYMIEIPKMRGSTIGTSGQSDTTENVVNLARMINGMIEGDNGSIVIDQVNYRFPSKNIKYGVTKKMILLEARMDIASGKKHSVLERQTALRHLVNEKMIALNKVTDMRVRITDLNVSPYFCTSSQGFTTFIPHLFDSSIFDDVLPQELHLITSNATTKYATYVKTRVLDHQDNGVKCTVHTYNVATRIKDFSKRAHDKIWDTIHFVTKTGCAIGVQYVRGRCFGADIVSGLFMSENGLMNVDKHVLSIGDEATLFSYAEPIFVHYGACDAWRSFDTGDDKVNYTASEKNVDILHASNIMSTLFPHKDMLDRYSEQVKKLSDVYSARILDVLNNGTYSTLDHSHDFQSGEHSYALRSIGAVMINAIPQYVREMQKSISAMSNNSTKIYNPHAGFTMYKSANDTVLYLCETCSNVFGSKLHSVICHATHNSYVRVKVSSFGSQCVKVVRLYAQNADPSKTKTYRGKVNSLSQYLHISDLPVTDSKPSYHPTKYCMLSLRVTALGCTSDNELIVDTPSPASEPLTYRKQNDNCRQQDGHAPFRRYRAFDGDHEKPKPNSTKQANTKPKTNLIKSVSMSQLNSTNERSSRPATAKQHEGQHHARQTSRDTSQLVAYKRVPSNKPQARGYHLDPEDDTVTKKPVSSVPDNRIERGNAPTRKPVQKRYTQFSER